MKGVRCFASTALGTAALPADPGTSSQVEQQFFPVQNSMSQYYLNLNFQPVKLRGLKDLKWKTNKYFDRICPRWKGNTLLNSNRATSWATQTLLSLWIAGNETKHSRNSLNSIWCLKLLKTILTYWWLNKMGPLSQIHFANKGDSVAQREECTHFPLEVFSWSMNSSGHLDFVFKENEAFGDWRGNAAFPGESRGEKYWRNKQVF